MKIPLMTLLFVLPSIVFAEPKPVPYVAIGRIGVILEADVNPNLQTLDKLVKAIQAEGWTIEVTPSYSEIPTSYTKAKSEKISDIVINKLRGCEIMDQKCLNFVRNLNRRSDIADFDAYEGVLRLPAQLIEFKISINAGENYRVEEIGKLTNAYMSKKLHSLLEIANKLLYGQIGTVCRDECTEIYRLTIE